MKVKILSRNPDEYLRECKHDIYKVQRNYDPALHPFEAPREYVRALNAAKLERVFAKPFLRSLEGHKDGIQAVISFPKKLAIVVSGCCDGEVKLWNLPKGQCVHTFQAHTGFVRGLCFDHDSQSLFSVGDDNTIKHWSVHESNWGQSEEALNVTISKTMLTGITHHRNKSVFATCGERVDVWDESRAEPLKTFTWGADSICSVKFNQIEENLIGSCANDRSIVLYDIRMDSPARKVTLSMRSNTITWNPMEAFIFTAANEDHNLYTFDIRHLKAASSVHVGHTQAVIDADYAPTGKEFVTGSYDRTIRIFNARSYQSREVYHTKRMQRLNCVLWSKDNKYVLSGSDEMNIRVWKADASEKLGVVKMREELAFNYSSKLKEKFAHHPEIKRILRHRHVPKHVYHARKQKIAQLESIKRRESNRRLNSKPGTVPEVPVSVKPIVNVEQ